MLVRCLESRSQVIVVKNKDSEAKKNEGANENHQRHEWEFFESFAVACSCVQGKFFFEAALASFDVMACNPDIEDDINPEQVYEEPKIDVVALAHTV